MPSLLKLVQILALFGSVTASPVPDPQNIFPPPTCIEGDGQVKYTVDSQKHIQAPQIIGDYTVSGGDSLTKSSTFSQGTTVTVGTDLSLAKIVGVGLSASVSYTTTKSTTEGASAPCPKGPWKCGLAIFPSMLEVKGQQLAKHKHPQPCKKVPAPYTVQYPIIGESGAVQARVEVCACKNFKHWADKGAPSIVCDICPL